MDGEQGKELMDVHGAGAQRSDFKDGSMDDWPEGFGPQGDVIRIENYVKCVTSRGSLLGTFGAFLFYFLLI